MRRALKYQFTAPATADRLAKTTASVEAWLDSKGQRRGEGPEVELVYQTGRVARLHHGEERSKRGQVTRWTLSESDGERKFVTALCVVQDEGRLLFSCDFDVGVVETVIAPIGFDAFCPNVVKDVLGIGGWSIGDTPVTNSFVRFAGSDGGGALAEFLRDRRRRVPVVVVSEYDGLPLHLDLPKSLARDLAGAAVVAWIDEDASWSLTDEIGKEFSCYLGAVRLYWPRFLEEGRAPIWTALRLMDLGPTRRDASTELRSVLRRQVLPLTALTVAPDFAALEIEADARKDRLDAQLLAAKSAGNVEAVFEQLAAENAELYARLQKLQDDNTGLLNRLENEAVLQQWQQHTEAAGQGAVAAPAAQDEPQTVKDAVDAARKLFAEQITFGDDVDDGVESVAGHAGPPPKILRFLSGLAKMSDALKQGPLGLPPIAWLNERGLTASGESETIRNSASETQRRTWHDGTRRIVFELHLKPNEATSPDQCVRIYFALDNDAKRVRVGWIGKHP